MTPAVFSWEQRYAVLTEHDNQCWDHGEFFHENCKTCRASHGVRDKETAPILKKIDQAHGDLYSG